MIRTRDDAKALVASPGHRDAERPVIPTARRCAGWTWVAILVLGAALRLYGIDAQSLWFDELLSIDISRLSLASILYSPGSFDPPLYYLLLRVWLGFGGGDGVVRLLSALCALATIPVLYRLAQRVVGEAAAALTVLVYAVAPLQLYYAQEARMYALLVLLGTLTMWFYLAAQESARRRDWVIWIVLTILLIYAHTLAALLLVALDADACLSWRRRRRSILPLILSNVAIGLFLLPQVLLTLHKMTFLMPTLWLTPPTVFHPILTLHAFLFGYSLPAWANVAALCLTITVCTFMALAVYRRWRNGNDRERDTLQFLLLVLCVPIGLLWLVSQWKSVYIDRMVLPSAIGLYILLAWSIAKSDRRVVMRICAVVGLPLLLLANYNYYADPEYGKPPLRQALAYVAERRAADERIVHTSDSSFLAGRHYDAGGDHVLLYHPADLWLTPSLMDELGLPYVTNAVEATSASTDFWVIVAMDHIPQQQMAEKAELSRRGSLLEQTEIGKIWIAHFAGPKP